MKKIIIALMLLIEVLAVAAIAALVLASMKIGGMNLTTLPRSLSVAAIILLFALSVEAFLFASSVIQKALRK